MPRKNIYEMNYARLEVILGRPPERLEESKSYRFRAEGYMDLVVENIGKCEWLWVPRLSLAHYHKVNGDLCQDPEVVIRIYPPGSSFEAFAPSTDIQFGRVEAVEFQQAIPPIFQEVYPQPGRYNPVLRNSLNSFLALWLRNLRSQGHRFVEETVESGEGNAVTVE